MKNNNSNLDLAGIFASSLCAVHCAAVPMLIAFGIISGSHWLHNHAIDWIIITIGIVIASYSLVKDFRFKHKSTTPLLVAGLGFTFLLLGMADHHHGILHTILSVCGGLTVALAHFINIRKSHFQCRVVHLS